MADEIPSSSGNDAPQERGGNPLEPPFAVKLESIDRKCFAASAVVSFLIYLFTLAPDVTLEWSGILVAAATHAGVGPPPGYPAWTLYSWCFTKLLPFSNHAWRVAVGSAFAAAVANGLIAMMVSCGIRVLFENTRMMSHLEEWERRWIRWGSGFCAGLTFGFAGNIWGGAVSPHFWAFGNMLFAGIIAGFTFWVFAPERKQFLYLAFFLFGLLLTGNQELLIALPGLIGAVMLIDRKLGRDLAVFILPVLIFFTAVLQFGIFIGPAAGWNFPLGAATGIAFTAGLILIGVTRRCGTEWKSTLLCGTCAILGLSFYFYLPIAAMTTPPVDWGHARTPEGFMHMLVRGQFERANPTSEWGRYLGQLWLYVVATGMKLGWPQMVISVLPICFLRVASRQGKFWLLGLLAIWICAGPGIVALMNTPLDRQGLELAALYFMASHVILALWMGLGIAMLAAWATRPNRQKVVPADLPV